jgi:hypothetical protein
MPSNYAPLAVVVMLLLAGCSMLPGSDDAASDQTDATAPSTHDLVFTSDVDSFAATVTVTKDGEQVYKTNVSGGDGAYEVLTTFDEAGPYTLTVDTNVSVGGDNMSEQMQIPAESGNATVVELNFASVSTTPITLPRQELSESLGAYNRDAFTDSRDLEVRVEYRGERVTTVSETVPSTDEVHRVVALNRTGVYNVSARLEDEWYQQTVVVTDPEEFIVVRIGREGAISDIQVKEVANWA